MKGVLSWFRGYCALYLFIGIAITGCSEQQDIKIGMIAGLTGRATSLGVAGRDGAILAVEEINSNGGVRGRAIELIVRDDKQQKEVCEKVTGELIQAKVDGIVGPMTSSMGLVVASHINKNAVPTISPTVSTSELAGKDDYFLRVIPVATNAAVKTAEYLYEQKKYTDIYIVHDMGNRSYTEPWYKQFEQRFMEVSNGKVYNHGYMSKNGYDFLSLAKKLMQESFDCIILLASAMDTAMISQQLRKLGNDKLVMACEWSVTSDLLEHGGSAVEGLEVFHSYDWNSKKESAIEFNELFQARFGYQASFASAYAYNAVNILAPAIANYDEPEDIRKAIIQNSPYNGVQRQIHINSYGDAQRDYTLLKIQNNKITTSTYVEN